MPEAEKEERMTFEPTYQTLVARSINRSTSSQIRSNHQQHPAFGRSIPLWKTTLPSYVGESTLAIVNLTKSGVSNSTVKLES